MITITNMLFKDTVQDNYNHKCALQAYNAIIIHLAK